MPQPWHNRVLTTDPAWLALVNRVSLLEGRLSAQAFTMSAKRFRLGSFALVAAVGAGSSASGSVTWTSPMTTDDYKVDVTVSALAGAPVGNISVSAQTVNGCTVTFTVPSLVALGATVVVLAISAPN